MNSLSLSKKNLSIYLLMLLTTCCYAFSDGFPFEHSEPDICYEKTSASNHKNNSMAGVYAGPDTLICGFVYQLEGNLFGGNWRMLCSESAGQVTFGNTTADTTLVKVERCGEYTFIYEVNTGPCIGIDTVVVGFEDPSSLTIVSTLDIDLTLEMDCPDPNEICGNELSLSGLSPPSALIWDFGGSTSCTSIIHTTGIGPVIDSCIVGSITCDTTTFSASSSNSTTNSDVSGDNILDIISDLFSAVPLNCPLPTQCFSVPPECIDTLVDSSYLYVPILVDGGLWHYYTDTNTWEALTDTSFINIDNQNYVLILDPGADYIGPDNLNFTLYKYLWNNNWSDPTESVEITIEYVPTYEYDTLLIVDTLYVVNDTCYSFSCGGISEYSTGINIPPPPGGCTTVIGFHPPPPDVELWGVIDCNNPCVYFDVCGQIEVICDAGNYSILCIDENGCEYLTTLNVFYDYYIPTIDFIGYECAPDNESYTVSFSVSGGNIDIGIDWGGSGTINYNNPITISGITNCTEITVYAVDNNNGCYVTQDFYHCCECLPTSSEASAAICEGDSYDFFGQVLTAAGSYEANLVNSNGCDSIITLNLEVLDPIGAIEPPDILTCDVDCTYINAFNSSGDTYNWETSNGEIAGDPGSLFLEVCGSGTYCLTTTSSYTYPDGSGTFSCSSVECVTVTQDAEIPGITVSVNNSNCSGSNTGSAVVTINNSSIGPFDYEWIPNVSQTNNASDLSEGAYTVIVTAANGCSVEQTITIDSPEELVINTTQNDIACNGDLNGDATAFPTGGTGPFTYLWCNGQTSPTATGLGAGACSVVVTDANNCTATAMIICLEPEALNLSTSQEEVSCYGGNNGAATVIPSGGVAPYSYQWSSGGNEATAANLNAGIYTVVVVDANGCEETMSVELNEPPALSITGTSQDALCGNNDGSINITVAGGTEPYNYDWNTGSQSNNLTNLSPGTYTVTVTDDSNCTTTFSINVETPDGLEATTLSTDVSCYGSSDGTIAINVIGGLEPYDYQWDSSIIPSGSAEGTDLPAGNYSVTVIDAAGCVYTTSATIIAPEMMLIDGSATDETCGETNGSISINIQGGTGPYSCLWSPSGGTAQNPSNLGAGTYSVVVTDANGCTETFDISVAASAELELSISSTDITCNGQSDGMIDLTVTGEGPFEYVWSGAAIPGIQDPSDLSAGTYTVVVTDNNDCIETTSITVMEPEALSITGTSQDALCGNNDGSINITVAGGTEPYNYDWNTGNQSNNLSNLSPGIYTVTVTDNNDCIETFDITVATSPLLALSVSSTDINCYGGNDGIATVIPSGGLAPYSYQWSSGGNEAIAGNLSAGIYTVTVVDANGCEETISVDLSEPTALNITGTSQDALCGNNDGSINITVAGGTEPYNYDWNTGNQSNNLTNLSPGTYTVTVTDDNNCTATFSINVETPDGLEATAVATNVSCYGNSDGTVAVNVIGGLEPYDYQWDSSIIPSGSAEGTDLPAGNYSVTVIDAAGCVYTTSATIIAPEMMLIDGSATDATCGETNGSISINVQGGSGPYSYLWSPTGATVQNLTNLSAGNYSVIVTDANDCIETFDITVATLPSLALSVSSTDINCYGDNDGIATVIPSGGLAPYSYQWSSGGNEAIVGNLSAGIYTVTVVDSNGCEETISVDLSEPTALNITGTSQDALCGNNDGSINITVAGGTEPYNYDWNTGNQSNNLSNLSPGTYTVTVTDYNNCTATFSINVETPDGIEATTISTDVSCYGNSDGTIDVNVIGGLEPYNYEWNSLLIPSGSAGGNDLPGGNYSVTVTDANNCEAVAVTTIEEPPLLSIAILSPTQISCHGGDNGSIDVTVTGGTEPYYYNWDNAPDVANPTGLAAGSYAVTVTDSNGCISIDMVTLTAPPDISLSAIPSSTSCSASADGEIDLTITGGTVPYNFEWSNGNTNEDPTGLPAGAYTVEVTDDNGCIAVLEEQVDAPEEILLQASVLSDYNGFNLSCNESADGAATVLASGGTAPFSYSWSNGNTTATANNLLAGTYTVVVSDANGCLDETSVTLEAPAAIFANIEAQATTCFGDEDGTIMIHGSEGGAVPYQYALNGGDFVQSGLFNNLPAGNYDLTIQDANGCETTFNQTIIEPAELQVDLEVIEGEEQVQLGNKLLLNATISPDTSYLLDWGWTEGEYWMDANCNSCLTREIQPLASTMYEYLIRDEKGCMARSEVMVEVLKDRPVFIPNAFSPNGDGVNDYFQIYLGSAVSKVNAFRVYDRWGEVVYEMSDFFVMSPEQGWDGMFKGNLVNSGVFVYWAEVEFLDGHVEIYKGDVTLVR